MALIRENGAVREKLGADMEVPFPFVPSAAVPNGPMADGSTLGPHASENAPNLSSTENGPVAQVDRATVS